MRNNTYIDAPSRLGPHFELRTRPSVRFAGLLTGVEGYIESCAMDLVAAWLLAGKLDGREVPPPPPTTMLGGLYHHVTAPREPGYRYGPTNALGRARETRNSSRTSCPRTFRYRVPVHEPSSPDP